MINLVIDKNAPKNLSKRAAYAFFYLTEPVDEDISVSFFKHDDCVNIFYGIELQGTGNVYIPRFNGRGAPNVIEYEEYIYMAFEKDGGVPFFVKDGNVFFTFDIIKSSFYLISCGEEYDSSLRDSIGRFLGKYSCRRGKINVPLFDIHSDMLLDAIKIINHNVKFKDKLFEKMLTHDVDNINSRNIYVLMHDMKELGKRTNYPFGYKVKTLFADIIRNRHLQINNYIKIEAEKGVKSEFYFIEGCRHRLGRRYELSTIKNEIENLKCNGYIIGMHTNYFSYDDENEIKKEKESIEKYIGSGVTSCRNHYLRFNVPDTWRVLRGAGILCDTTLGFSDRNGFRAGTSRAFVPYDADNDELIDIAEVPLVIMDGTVMEQRVSIEDKWCEIKNILDEVIEYGGSSSLLWHQRIIYDENYRTMYEKILDYINKKGGRYILSKDVIQRTELQQEKLNYLFNLVERN